MTPACYSHMTHMLMTLANGKVAVCLEVSDLSFFLSSSSGLRGLNPMFEVLFLNLRLTHVWRFLGWLQLSFHLKISFGSNQDTHGRTTRASRCYNAIKSSCSGGADGHVCAIKVLAVHVSQTTSSGGTVYSQISR